MPKRLKTEKQKREKKLAEDESVLESFIRGKDGVSERLVCKKGKLTTLSGTPIAEGGILNGKKYVVLNLQYPDFTLLEKIAGHAHVLIPNSWKNAHFPIKRENLKDAWEQARKPDYSTIFSESSEG